MYLSTLIVRAPEHPTPTLEYASNSSHTWTFYLEKVCAQAIWSIRDLGAYDGFNIVRITL